jgi:thioredoxin-related protein
MKRLFVALAAAGALMAFTSSAPDPLPIGSKLPMANTKVKDVSGKEMELAQAAKKNGLLIMFSCNTCPYVIKNQTRTNQIAKFALENNVGVLILNSNEAYRNGDDSFKAMQEYAKEQGYNWHYAIDEKSAIADAFGANRTPECFLFSKEMTLVYHGAIDDSPSDESAVQRIHLREAISEMVKGAEVSVKQSKSIGCTIKRKTS